MARDFHEFPPQEYQLRYSRAREIMEEEGLDALLVADAVNCRYFTGYFPRTNNRPAFFILPLEGDPVILASSDLGARDAVQMSYVKRINAYDLPFRPVFLSKQLNEMGLGKARIGVEIDDRFFGSFRSQLQIGGFAELVRLLPGVTFEDSSDIMWRLRSVKTQREVECIRKACEITALAYEDTFRQTRQGMTEREVAEMLFCSMIKRGADLATLGKPGPCPAIFIDATRPAEEVHVPTDKRLEKGDLLHLDSGSIYNGYCSDFGRSATVGPASRYQRECWKKMIDSVYSAIEILRPGVRLGQIPCHWHATGLEFVEGPFGGLVNRGVHQDLVLEPGMVLCLEDMTTGASGETYQFEEVIVATEKGVEILSVCDPELREIETIV